LSSKILNALLFDTRSIQKYIFSGNRLSTNIGASYIVDTVFNEILVGEVLTKFFPQESFSVADTAWNIAADNLQTWADMKNCAVAYIGGGNALILFDNVEATTIKKIVEKFTMLLLSKRPGLKVGAATGKLSVTDGKLNQQNIDDLYKKLKATQNKIFPAVNVPYTGLTLTSDTDGEVANFCDTKNIVRKDKAREIRFFSQETAVKAEMAFVANENLKSRFKEIFAVKNFDVDIEKYNFPFKINELGQREKENYFAIVHVDGNNMGVKFRSCQTLTERRKLSREIRRKTEGSFADLLKKIISAVEENIFADLKLEKNCLPIRPLIIGGDDVTFICPAKAAVLFTKTLMEILNSKTPENAPENLTQEIARKIDCCAGIAILPTAYPFFRGYELAEQLCDSAKSAMRRNENPVSSWLDFAILHGEQPPTLSQIRENDYKGALGDLHFGAYQIANQSAENKIARRKNIENLLTCTEKFSKLPRSKVKELRFILARGEDDIKKYLAQLEHQNLKLPVIEDWQDYLKDNLFSGEENKKTPFIDAIEMMDFYNFEVAEKWQNLQ